MFPFLCACWYINLFLFVLLSFEYSFVCVVYIVCFSIMSHHKLWEQHYSANNPTSPVQRQDAVKRTYRMRWTIETKGELESGKSMLTVCHDDDIYTYVYVSSIFFKKYVWLNRIDTSFLLILLLIHSSLWIQCREKENLVFLVWRAI